MKKNTEKNQKSIFKNVMNEDKKNSLDEAIITTEKTKTIPAEEKKEEVLEEMVYEIKFIRGDSSYLLYSETIAIDEENLMLFSCFTRTTLSEVINPQSRFVITELGRKEMSESNVEVPLRFGVNIRKIVREDWMFRSEEETKKVFDEKVLQGYRDLHKRMNNQQHIQHEEDFDEQQFNQRQNNRNNDERYNGISRAELKDL